MKSAPTVRTEFNAARRTYLDDVLNGINNPMSEVSSLFHFWITLEAPMRGVKNDSSDNLPPYKEGAILEIIEIYGHDLDF